jgi:mono/diheme cytochrome c family protein
MIAGGFSMQSCLGRTLLVLLPLIGLAVSLSQAQEERTSSLERGAALYRGHCAACHGIDGNGNGPKATGMLPSPTNFRDAAAMGARSDNALEQAILAGKSSTAMPGYGTIFDAHEVAALVAYLRSLSGPQ